MSFPAAHTSFDNSKLIDFSINKKLIPAAAEHRASHSSDNPGPGVHCRRTERERGEEGNKYTCGCLPGINYKQERMSEEQQVAQPAPC